MSTYTYAPYIWVHGEKFFQENGIVKEDLIEVPIRVRDGSIHFYHPKKDIVYSYSFIGNGWSIRPNVQKFRTYVT